MPEHEQDIDVIEENQCPLPETHDRFNEAHYFLELMMHQYHSPEPFRWNLNAFIQALRNVTFVMQAELKSTAGFSEWYTGQQTSMKQDPSLRAFVDGRNMVVKERNLLLESSAQIGLFRNRKLKLVLKMPIQTNIPSEYALKYLAPKLEFLDDEHWAIGEEYGVQREWKASELGTGNVLALCDAAWAKIGKVVSEAHTFAGFRLDVPPADHHDPVKCDLLTETDIDPSLIDKWGW